MYPLLERNATQNVLFNFFLKTKRPNVTIFSVKNLNGMGNLWLYHTWGLIGEAKYAKKAKFT